MKMWINPLAAALTAGLAVPALADQPSLAEVTELAREAYLWGYPMVDNYAILYSYALAPNSAEYKAPLNEISHVRRVAGPEDRAIVAPNVDTPYSYAWIDLRAEPVVLTLPEFEPERYISLQLIDAYTYILGYVTPRTNGNAGGDFLVAGPGWKGTVPDGVEGVFRAPTDLVLAHYRSQILGPDDLKTLHALQDAYLVRTLSAFAGTEAPPQAPPLEPVQPLDVRKQPFDMQFFTVLNWMLRYMPALPDEAAMRDRFAAIGIGAGLDFQPDAQTRAAIEAGMQQALAQMQARAGTVRSSAELFGSREFLGQDYLIRAVATMIGIYGNSAEEYLGVGYQTDSEGQPFDGRQNYTITFPKGGFPDVGAFWSITVYDADRFVCANEIDRYSINSSMVPDLEANADGSVTIYVQHEKPPASVANWLPVPDTPFGLTFRTYLPGPAIRDGSWRAPPVVQTKQRE